MLVYQLLLRAGVNDERRFRQCAFPIVSTHDPTDRQQVARYTERMKKAIEGLQNGARDCIEAVQPWRPGNPGIWSHLSQVEELDNTQKHRLLLTGVVAFRMRNFVLNDNGVAKLIPEAFLPIGPGQMAAFFERGAADDLDLSCINRTTAAAMVLSIVRSATPLAPNRTASPRDRGANHPFNADVRSLS